MIAKIVSENREYYSNVFAKFNTGWNECVIVFDNENKKFEFVPNGAYYKVKQA